MTPTSSDSDRTDSVRRGHEPDTVSVRRMAGIGLGMFGMLILILAGIAAAFKIFLPSAPPTSATEAARQQRMVPGVEPNQAYDRVRIEAEERATLSRYGWQDKERGVARIPIDRAMELMARRKLQVAWPTDEKNDSADSTNEVPQ